MAGQVNGTDGALVHEKDHLAASTAECRPVPGEHGLVECVVVAANVVRCDEFPGRKDGTNLCIESIEGGGCERFRLGNLCRAARLLLFGLNENEDGNMLWMRVRPAPDQLKAAYERLAGAAVIDILHVHYFEAGLGHDAVGIEFRIGRQVRSGNHRRTRRMRVETAFAVGIYIKFDLANAAIELLIEWLMPIVEAVKCARTLCLPQRCCAWCKAGVITVVRTDDLDFVNAELLVLLGAGWQSVQ